MTSPQATIWSVSASSFRRHPARGAATSASVVSDSILARRSPSLAIVAHPFFPFQYRAFRHARLDAGHDNRGRHCPPPCFESTRLRSYLIIMNETSIFDFSSPTSQGRRRRCAHSRARCCSSSMWRANEGSRRSTRACRSSTGQEFCSTTYGVTFPLFSKISVKAGKIGWNFAEIPHRSPGKNCRMVRTEKRPSGCRSDLGNRKDPLNRAFRALFHLCSRTTGT